ncbi:MAG: hypothetical protein HUJ59_01645 [Bacilli bacterium]|nr:hypothetical protein [Bacilli bacterium]
MIRILLNSLSTPDIVFFSLCAGIIVLCVAIYFLIPVFNRKQYREARENLEKREKSFRANIQRTDGKKAEDIETDK